MYVIGHRGAIGPAVENTIDAFEFARVHGADAVELDVRLSSDGEVVVFHDAVTTRLAPATSKWIASTSAGDLQKIKLPDGASIPLLKDVLTWRHGLPLIVEIKDPAAVPEVARTIRGEADVSVASFSESAVRDIRKSLPQTTVYLLERSHPYRAILKASAMKLSGVGLRYTVMNPAVYWYARRHGLDIYLYPPTNVIAVRVLHFLYPKALICTNRPERFESRKRP
jgi:glycerophosphoryl diester phosphodiesterase